MKKLIIIGLLVAASLTGCDQGSMLNSEQQQPDHVTRLTAAGIDLRVYEFTPVMSPNKSCIFVAGENKGGLVCFDK